MLDALELRRPRVRARKVAAPWFGAAQVCGVAWYRCCHLMKHTFIGTVVACETRFTTSVKRAFSVYELQANWILTIDVESADDGAPAVGGTRASFLIHSPTHTLLVAAEHAPGHRFRFEIERETTDGGIRWSEFSGREID